MREWEPYFIFPRLPKLEHILLPTVWIYREPQNPLKATSMRCAAWLPTLGRAYGGSHCEAQVARQPR